MPKVDLINPFTYRGTPRPIGETAAEETALSAREVGNLNLVSVVCGEAAEDIPARADLGNRIVVPVAK